MIEISIVLCLVAIIIGTITDLRTREVPDWLNYSLIFIGIGYAIIRSLVYSSPSYIIESIAGLGFFFAIAYIMYYTGQWGGGDSKMVMGIGAMIGLNVFEYKQWPINPPFVFNFVIFTLVVGAVYGLIWSIVAAFIERKKFMSEFFRRLKKPAYVKIKWVIIITISALLITSVFLHGYPRLMMLLLVFLIPTTFYIFIFIKAVEKVCMLKRVDVDELTEGDWIGEEVSINGKIITGPKDLGITKEKIETLRKLKSKGKIEKVLIKVGIPFVPSFLLAFILALVIGNKWLFFLI